jgi:hypothetical protein
MGVNSRIYRRLDKNMECIYKKHRVVWNSKSIKKGIVNTSLLIIINSSSDN